MTLGCSVYEEQTTEDSSLPGGCRDECARAVTLRGVVLTVTVAPPGWAVAWDIPDEGGLLEPIGASAPPQNHTSVFSFLSWSNKLQPGLYPASAEAWACGASECQRAPLPPVGPGSTEWQHLAPRRRGLTQSGEGPGGPQE